MQHIVSDVDDVVNRALAGGFDRLFEPFWTGANLDAFDTDRGIMWADVRRTELDAGKERITFGVVFGAGVDLGVFDCEVELCRQLAGYADVAKHVDTVRGDLKVEDRVPVGVEVVDWGAERDCRI